MLRQTTLPITLADLQAIREEIFALAARHGADHVRVFGSVARGEATANSDVDFLVRFREGSSIFDQVGLWLDLKDLLGREVDLVADHPSGGRIMQLAIQEAVPL